MDTIGLSWRMNGLWVWWMQGEFGESGEEGEQGRSSTGLCCEDAQQQKAFCSDEVISLMY